MSFQTTSSLNLLSSKATLQVTLHAIFDWYRDDFGTTEEQMLKWLLPFLPSTRQKSLLHAIEHDSFSIRYSSFDWSLNKKQHLSVVTPGSGHYAAHGGQHTYPQQIYQQLTINTLGAAGKVGSGSENGTPSPAFSPFGGTEEDRPKKPPPGVNPPPTPPPPAHGLSPDGVPLPPRTPPKFRPSSFRPG